MENRSITKPDTERILAPVEAFQSIIEDGKGGAEHTAILGKKRMRKIEKLRLLGRLIKKMYGSQNQRHWDQVDWEIEALHLGQKIQSERLKLRVSLEEVAERAKVNLYYVYQAEHDPSALHISILKQIIEKGLGGRLKLGMELND